MSSDLLKYAVPGENHLALTTNLVSRLKSHLSTDRENRFQLFLLAAGIRRRYVTKRGGKDEYASEFTDWYKENDVAKLFGQLPNFTKYALAGEVIDYTAKNIKDAEKYLLQLPTSMNALYAVHQLYSQDKKLFDICLRVHPKRKNKTQAQSEWGTVGNDPLINPLATQRDIEAFISRWFGDDQPPAKNAIPRNQLVLLAKVFVSKDLFSFDKVTGKHLGNVDLPDVTKLLEELSQKLKRSKSFEIDDEPLGKIKTKYYRTKDKSGPKRKITKVPSKRIVKSKTAKKKSAKR